ncbi:MAG: nucleotidyltransferase family protein [Lysobacter sp.]|nr:nucleotidyltransferase family protein [Lysobacter sp.]
MIRAMTSPEPDWVHSALFACAIAAPDIDLSGQIAEAGGSAPSWERLMASAAAHKLRPPLYRQVVLGKGRNNPACARVEEAEAYLRACAIRGMSMMASLARAIETLRNAEILAVPFKGPVFAEVAGAGMGSREMNDLDLMIRPSELPRAARALSELGFRTEFPREAFASPWLTKALSELPLWRECDALLLELHWRAAPRWFAAPCTVDEVLSRLSTRKIGGVEMWWPAPEDLLLLHVADGMKSCGYGMRWVADLLQILGRNPELEWDRVRRTASAGGGINGVRVALAVAERLADDARRWSGVAELGAPLPDEARMLAGEARGGRRMRRAIAMILSRLSQDAVTPGAVAHFRWALLVGDDRWAVAGETLRYLLGPAAADLAAIKGKGESDVALRLKALKRRLGGIVR